MIDVPFNHPAWIEIDLVQFKKNIHAIRQYIGPNVKLCLPIKSNAYGHGLIHIARAAVAAKVDSLAVSCLQEGILLRQASIKIPILVLGAIHIEQIADFIDYDLEFTISSHFKAKMVAQACEYLGKTVKVHLEVDTGMNRTGVRVETGPMVLEFFRMHKCFILKGVYSHLATADEPDHPFSRQQVDKFLSFLTEQGLIDNKDIQCHLSNSAGLVSFPEANLDMVRPGGLAFGCYPTPCIPKELSMIKPCFAVRAKVSYFKTVLKGEGVSYSHSYVAQTNIHLLTVPVGYGDGLRRSLSNKASILLNGKRYPMVGNICMDQFMVDIGQDPGYVGNVVTIIGKDLEEEITIEEQSQLANTHPYEILCGFNNRLPRVYHTETQSVWENVLTVEQLAE